MAFLLTAFTALALQVHPVARPMKVPLEQVAVAGQSCGALIRFSAQVDKAAAKAVLDAAGEQFKFSATFITTEKGRFVVLEVLATINVGTLLTHAENLSASQGVEEVDVWFHPGPRNEDLELEATWRYEQGALAEKALINFRDVPVFTQYARRKASKQEWNEARWPGHPLSKLTQRVGFAGRFAFETTGAMEQMLQHPWPKDAGENLALLDVWVPDGVALELRAEAELKKGSVSKVVGDLIEAAIKLGVRPPTSTEAVFDEDSRAQQRELILYLSQANSWRIDEAAQRGTVSANKVVQYAWRLAHPYAAPAKVKVSK